jgi:porin
MQREAANPSAPASCALRRGPVLASALLAVAGDAGAASSEGQLCLLDDACPGLAMAASYTSDLHDNLHGGVRTGGTWSHMVKLGAEWKADGAGIGARFTNSVSMMYMGGRGISGTRVGDLQGLSNIEAPQGLRLYEIWSEARFGTGASSLRAGFLDLNAEFDVPETSALFVGPPYGIGTEFAMSGRNGPAIWPVTGVGMRLQGDAGRGVQWRLAAYEGEPGDPDATPFVRLHLSQDEGALLVSELSWRPARGNKLQVGAWHYTARFMPMDPADSPARGAHGNQGAYALADLPVATLGSARIDAALRIGAAAPRFNTVDRYAGLALVARNVWPSLPEDAMGVAVAHAHTSPGSRAATVFAGDAPRASETSFELTWRHGLGGQMAILPHVHYVMHPGAVDGVRDAWVLGLRFEASRSHHWIAVARQPDSPARRVARTSSAD